jgi:hypothetical protein
VIFDGLQPLDLVGPHEVFGHAQVVSPDAGYVCQVAATTAGPVRAASGLLVHAEYSVADLDPAGSTPWWRSAVTGWMQRATTGAGRLAGRSGLHRAR